MIKRVFNRHCGIRGKAVQAKERLSTVVCVCVSVYFFGKCYKYALKSYCKFFS